MSNTQIQSILDSVSAGSLGTLTSNGNPFVSLVTVAPIENAKMVMLLSGLAVHSQNLKNDSHASLMLVSPDGEGGDPLAGARVTFVGEVEKLARPQDEASRAAFLSRHSEAAMYADFGDFAIYELSIQAAHLVAGFGRIETLSRSELLSLKSQNRNDQT